MRSPKLLIAEGDAALALDLAGIAESLAMQTVPVTDGEAFKAEFETFQPDILAFEVFLREVDGLELISWLATRHTHRPVLLFTDRGAQYLRAGESLALLRGLPAVQALPKPLCPTAFEAALLAAVPARLVAAAGQDWQRRRSDHLCQARRFQPSLGPGSAEMACAPDGGLGSGYGQRAVFNRG